jgi:two-component system phosphate regulon response regulator PhoB
MNRVLIVEDDPDISSVVEFNLRKEGFDTEVTAQGSSALRIVRDNAPDLVLLDLMLPDLPGLEVCREIRASSVARRVPIVMVTAKGQESDRLAGLESGADDYIVKPFSMRELVLRIRAVLRRADATEMVSLNRLERGPIAIDEAAHRVFVDGNEAVLTNTEYKLLLMFVKRPGRVFSRRQLLDQVWNMPGTVVTRTVDTHVKRLREKLGRAGENLETVRSVGYRFVLDGLN